MEEKRGRRGFIVSDTLVPWMIVVLIIVLGAIAAGIFSGKLQAFIEAFKNFRRGG